jgi:transcriptional regulator with XRE-family HTH domain
MCLPYNDGDSYRRRLTWESAAMIRKARLAKDLSMAAAAKAAGISSPYWWMLENGHRAPSMATARDVARVLDLDWDQAEQLYSESAEDAGRSRKGRKANA